MTVASRIVAAVLLGYAFCSALAALAAVLLARAGMGRSEASVAAMMSGFVLYLMVLVWAFAAPRLPRVWLLMAGGTALAAAPLWILS